MPSWLKIAGLLRIPYPTGRLDRSRSGFQPVGNYTRVAKSENVDHTRLQRVKKVHDWLCSTQGKDGPVLGSDNLVLPFYCVDGCQAQRQANLPTWEHMPRKVKLAARPPYQEGVLIGDARRH